MTARGLATVFAMLVFLGADAVRAQQPPAADFGVPYLIPPDAVELDDKQREAIAAIRRDLQDRYCTLSGELLFAEEDLRAQMARAPRSPEAVAEAKRRVSDLWERFREARAEAIEQAEALLAPEQRKVLARWRAEEGGREGGAREGRSAAPPGSRSPKRRSENR